MNLRSPESGPPARRRLRARVLLFTALGGLTALGCAPPHVSLSAPPRDASAEDRTRAYDRLHAAHVRTTDVTFTSTTDGRAGPSMSSTRLEAFELGDGTKVYRPDDLLAVLDDRSEAARALREAQAEKRESALLDWGSIAGVVAGTALVFTDLGMHPSHRGPVFFVGIGVGALGLVALPFGVAAGRRAQDLTFNAFDGYNEGLRERLDLCTRGRDTIPCPTATQAPAELPH